MALAGTGALACGFPKEGDTSGTPVRPVAPTDTFETGRKQFLVKSYLYGWQSTRQLPPDRDTLF